MQIPLRLAFAIALAALFAGCDSTGRLNFGGGSREPGYRPEPEPFFRDRRGREVPGRDRRQAPDQREEALRDRRESPSEPRPTPTPSTQPQAASTPAPSPTPSFLPTPAPQSTAAAAGGGADEIRYGVPVPGKPGYVTSPYSPDAGYVDVTGLAPGTKAQDPYSGKVFLVP